MKLIELPTELLTGVLNELPNLDDLINISYTCKLMNTVSKVEDIWKHRIVKDYKLLGYVSEDSLVFRKHNFKQLYIALRNPNVYVWGETADGRSGLEYVDRYDNTGIDGQLHTPTKLKRLSGKGISSIVCGGYMMLALTHSKELYFWGTFNSTAYYQNEPYNIKENTPIKLEIFKTDVEIKTVTAGRSHALVQSIDNSIYLLDNPKSIAPQVYFDNEYIIKQIECGFSSCMVLTKDSKILYWNYELLVKPKLYFELNYDKFNKDEHFIKIGNGDKFSIAITNQGKVIYWDTSRLNETDKEYINKPMESIHLKYNSNLNGQLLNHTIDYNIQHVQCQFENVALFDENHKLFLGKIRLNNEDDIDNEENQDDNIQQQLMIEINKFESEGNPIQVSFGDWHTLILMEDGQLYSFGEHGLGLGPDLTTNVNTATKLDYFNKDYFVFYCGAAGWHSTALAVKLNNQNDEDDKVAESKPPRRQRPELTWQGVEIAGDFVPFSDFK